jgi:SAM-dependent methyltransferase
MGSYAESRGLTTKTRSTVEQISIFRFLLFPFGEDRCIGQWMIRDSKAGVVPMAMRLMPRRFVPAHSDNRMKFEGDSARARAAFLANRSTNLSFLLDRRYRWMNRYIRPDDIAMEIGCGAGLAEFFIELPKLLLTEVVAHPWVDICLDALHLPFAPSSVDVFICSNVIHHVPSPLQFLQDIHGCLKPNGYLLVQEPHPSLLFLLALRIMRHEGWSFDVDVFDRAAQLNSPGDAWSGNNAVSYLLFNDLAEFGQRCPGFRVVYDRFTEFFLFALSGGVTAKTRTIELPVPVLRALGWLDQVLCRMAPSVFAMGRSIALQKTTQ